MGGYRLTLRRLVYVSGTRADFGLMRRSLEAIARQPGMELKCVVTGMHLDERFGLTVREVEAAGFDIAARVPVGLLPATGANMARSIGVMLQAFTNILEDLVPQAVLLLGDRGEMLAGAISAAHLNIPVFHLHGGERSGTIDEPVRHAITKFAHVHLVATAIAGKRVVSMGEKPVDVHVVGAPGLDEVVAHRMPDRAEVMARHRLDPRKPMALMVFHPVLQEASESGQQVKNLLDAVCEKVPQILCLAPNADAGSDAIRAALEARRADSRLHLATHLPRKEFLDVMAVCDVMVGNSSAGVIEAASFGTPVVDVGSRQMFRERGDNVFSASCGKSTIAECLQAALTRGRRATTNPYGDGRTASRIAHIIAAHPLPPSLLKKRNDY